MRSSIGVLGSIVESTRVFDSPVRATKSRLADSRRGTPS